MQTLSSVWKHLWFGVMAAIHLTLTTYFCEIYGVDINRKMTTEIRNWAVVAAAMEAQGATNSEMYHRAKALVAGGTDPMPTSYPAPPLSISAA